jgi:uncharacterized membrane protein YeaQ/YmgE (transglycosylase-associated protein family)
MNMTIGQVIVYILIAAVVGLIAERIVGSGPWGLVGTVLVGLAGIWVMQNVLRWTSPIEIHVEGVPLITSIIGASIVALIVSFLMRGRGPRRVWRRR